MPSNRNLLLREWRGERVGVKRWGYVQLRAFAPSFTLPYVTHLIPLKQEDRLIGRHIGRVARRQLARSRQIPGKQEEEKQTY